MNDQEINIAIAEACGWTNIRTFTRHKDEWIDPNKAEIGMIGTPPEVGCCSVPSYATDLNAMHEAEKVLTPEQEAAYVTTLCLTVQPEPRLHHATARQRAEAFLRTIGKWKERE